MDKIVIGKVRSFGWKLVWAPLLHFLSSGLVGLLVYFLTLTIFSQYLSGGTGSPHFGMGGFSINTISLLLAVSFSVVLHIAEDYLLDWF